MLWIAASIPPLTLWAMLSTRHVGIIPFDQGLHVEQESVKTGDWLVYRFSYCVDTFRLPTFVHVSREIELAPSDDQGIINIPPPTDFVVTKRCESKQFLMRIPHIGSGRYILRLNTMMVLNPLRSSYQRWESEEFTILHDNETINPRITTTPAEVSKPAKEPPTVIVVMPKNVK